MAPLVSIVIPVGPAHAAHVGVALASCVWQTVPNWEALVINDSGHPIGPYADRRIRVLDADRRPGQRAAVARNTGFAAAAAPFVVPLDADDYLLPRALADLVRGHAAHPACYTYGWHYGLNNHGDWGLFRSPDYDRAKLAQFNLHPITALIPTAAVQEAGGCDEGTPGLEDWTLWLNLSRIGCCGAQIYGPTFVYRRDLGVNHVADIAGGVALMDAVRARFQNDAGEIEAMGCGCGGGAAAAKQIAITTATALLSGEERMQNGKMTLEYIGNGQGAQWFKVPSGQVRAGRGPAVRYVQVDEQDAAVLLQTGFFRAVPPPAAFVPPPVGVVAGDTEAESVSYEVPTEGTASKYPGKRVRKVS